MCCWRTVSLRGLLLLIVAIALLLGWIANNATAAAGSRGGASEVWRVCALRLGVRERAGEGSARESALETDVGHAHAGQEALGARLAQAALGDECFQSIAHVSLYVDIKKGQADATWVNKGTADLALSKLTTQTSVRTLQIGGEQVTDENLAYVGQMTGLEELSIHWAFHLTDKGFLHLLRLKRLRILEISKSKMTDASLEAIGKLTSLEELRIGGEGFSDRGLQKLGGLTRLNFLSLGEGSHHISDAGLLFLRNMKELELLDLRGWDVSDDGIATLRELKNLKTVYISLSKDEEERRKKLQGLLPGVIFE